jgi:hypothetical protein
VTRLGDFSPNGRFFYFSQFIENYKSRRAFCATFSPGTDCVLILTKIGLGNIFGDFSKTHLVTLVIVVRWIQ